MRKAFALILIVVAVAGCTGEAPPAAPAAVPAPAAATTPPENVMKDIKWELWPPAESPGKDVKPLLSIRAERVTDAGGDAGNLAFEGAQADVPARNAGESTIHIDAVRGVYRKGRGAMLKDGVTAHIDDMVITLEEITWEILPEADENGNTSVAFSDKPLKIASPTQNLEASRLRLYPDTNELELYDVKGEISFMGEQP